MSIDTIPFKLAALSLAVAAAAPCWAKDAVIYREAGERALVAVHPDDPDRVAVAGAAKDCASGKAIHHSADRAKSWRTLCSPTDGYVQNETPSFAFGADGAWLATQVGRLDESMAVDVWRSIDEGQSWSISTVDGPYSTHGYVHDARVHVDASPDSPHRGSVYLSYIWSDVADGSQTRVAYSRDGGSDWTRVEATPYDEGLKLGAGSLAIARNGRLYLAYSICDWGDGRDCAGSSRVRLVRSDDGGAHWGRPVTVADGGLPGDPGGIALPGTNVTVATAPSLAVDASHGPRKGELYVALTKSIGGRLQVATARSEDDGKTWSRPQPVSAAPGDQFSPTVSVSRRGELAVTWLDRRHDASGVRYQPMIAFSSDGARTFGEPRTLDQDLTDPGLSAEGYMGTSVSHAWTGQGVQTVFPGVGSGAGGSERFTLRVSPAKP